MKEFNLTFLGCFCVEYHNHNTLIDFMHFRTDSNLFDIKSQSSNLRSRHTKNQFPDSEVIHHLCDSEQRRNDHHPTCSSLKKRQGPFTSPRFAVK